MKTVGDILESRQPPVNSKLDNSTNTYTVNSYSNKKHTETVHSNAFNGLTKEIERIIEEHNGSKDGLASYIAEILSDEKSELYFLLLLKNNSPAKVVEAAHLTKEAASRGIIRTNKAIYFLGILRRWGFKTRFKNEVESNIDNDL